jgi:hypothetical protein
MHQFRTKQNRTLSIFFPCTERRQEANQRKKERKKERKKQNEATTTKNRTEQCKPAKDIMKKQNNKKLYVQSD